jgi:hypothetical protein
MVSSINHKASTSLQTIPIVRIQLVRRLRCSVITQNLNIRLAYNYRRRQELKLEDRPGTAGLSYGIGLKVSKFNLSYGRAIYHRSGPSNHISVTTAIGAW